MKANKLLNFEEQIKLFLLVGYYLHVTLVPRPIREAFLFYLWDTTYMLPLFPGQFEKRFSASRIGLGMRLSTCMYSVRYMDNHIYFKTMQHNSPKTVISKKNAVPTELPRQLSWLGQINGVGMTVPKSRNKMQHMKAKA